MKVAIGFHLQDGPWGGGNQFAHSLTQALEARGDIVRFNLDDRDVDIIVLTDPRWRSPNVSFGAGAILRYLLTRNPNALVVHRINECDERKNTFHMNRSLRWANYVADHTIFIAEWLEQLKGWQRNTPKSVILNGGNADLFQKYENIPWDGHQALRLVTHHWGGNRMKGFDVYDELDAMLGQRQWRNKIEFTYVGNLPKGHKFANAKHLAPLSGESLAKELARHHVYITASINEPGGMHHIEGALSGLPILYRASGALPEYCKGFGVEFEDNNFLDALQYMLENYGQFKKALVTYPHKSIKMCDAYLSLFDQLFMDRKKILHNRHLWRSPYQVARNLILL